MHIKKLGLGIIFSLLISLGISHAGSMSLSPTTGSLGMHCIYPINFSVNMSGIQSKAVDMRIIYSGDTMQFTGQGTGQIGYGTSLVRTGLTTVAINLGWASYLSGSKYWLINRSDLVTPLSGTSNIPYYSRYFQTITNVLTGYLDFYFSGAVYGSGTWNGDDSNIQSGVTNNFVDVLTSVNSGYYNFVARPCIPDTDPALFTGYASGITQSYLSGIAFTIYDFTGVRTSGYNSTEHYWFQSGTADNSNLANYVAVPTGTGIDNQYGVNSGTIRVSLSGLSFAAGAFTGESGGLFSGGTLVYTSFTLATFNNSNLFRCTPMSTSVDKGNALTWNRLDRGYDCLLTSTGLVGLSGIQLDSNQTLLVAITGADNLNFLGTVNTGFIVFSLTITGIDNTPPYIALSTYRWTGAFNGFNITGAGPSFTATQRSGWDYWTKDNIQIHLTGNEIIIMTNVVGFSGTDLNVYISGGNGYSGITQVLIFTGNMTGYVTFQDIANIGMDPNFGQTFETGGTRYTYNFNVDVFWIDRITTQITGSLAYTGENGQLHRATLTLTGFATGNAESIRDDEFYVYAYSGLDGATNTPNVTYVTGYNSGAYSLYHSGIVFNDNWTGYIFYRDRANNTGQMYVNVTGINVAATYAIIAVPEHRSDLSALGIPSNSGMIMRFVLYSGGTPNYTLLQVDGGQVIFSGLVRTNSTGIYTFNYGLPFGSGYALLVEGQSHLSQFLTGITITGARIFDMRIVSINSGYAYVGDLPAMAGLNMNTGDDKNGQINSADLATLLSWIQISYETIYSGGFHVFTGGGSKVPLSGTGRLPLVQYYPADLNADGDIGALDQTLLIFNLLKTSLRTVPVSDTYAPFFYDTNFAQ